MNNLKLCAASDKEIAWHSINWQKCNQYVRRLQVRIVKAKEEGRHNKVKALQWLLTHSFAAKALAVKRVTENRGKKTAGVDGITWSTPKDKSQAILSLTRKSYRPLPLRRVYIPKANGKKRPLGIPTMKDRAMQALYLLALIPIAETTADNNSYGFRPERATADAIGQCFTALARKKVSASWILEGDIKGCFDNINHYWLLNNVPMDKGILRKWLKAGFMEKKQLFPTEEGTPQGGIISPTLANIALDGLEELLEKQFPNSKVNFVRYADDFIITGKSKELLEDKVKPLVEDFLSKRGLQLSQEKTKITHIEEGFDFLGQNIRKYGGKLLIKPSKKNIKTFLDGIREVVKGNKTATQENLISILNPKIRGWANYHRHVVAKETFSRIDMEIWRLLWQWAVRRHPNKPKRWIKKKYFSQIGFKDWNFSNDEARLLNISSVAIQRHVKIKGNANPFKDEYNLYFEKRWRDKTIRNLKGNAKLLKLWLNQKGICLICKQKLSTEYEWDTHHIVKKAEGGHDGITNLMMLHPNCHRQVHYQKNSVDNAVCLTAN